MAKAKSNTPKPPTFPVIYWTYNDKVYSNPPSPPTTADGKPDLSDPDYAEKYDVWVEKYNAARTDFQRAADSYNREVGVPEATPPPKATQRDNRSAVQRWLGIGEPVAALEGALAQPAAPPAGAPRGVTLPPEAAKVAAPPVRPATTPQSPEAATAPAATDTGWMNQLNNQYAQSQNAPPAAIPTEVSQWLQGMMG